jgi:hypothetical protein
MQAAVAEPPITVGDSLGSAFGGLFSSQASAKPAATSTDASAPEASTPKRSATATVRKPKPARRDAPAAVANLRPGTEARKDEPPEAAKPKKPKAEGEQQASAFAPPASNGGLISGAQPVIPSGSFDSRWQGLH